jgi:hypothetical protein
MTTTRLLKRVTTANLGAGAIQVPAEIDFVNATFTRTSLRQNERMHVRTGNGLMTSGCDSRLGKR